MISQADADIQPLLKAAMTLVAADGLKGLSLRPLAERLGTTVSALSHRFGLKDALIAALIDAAREADALFLDTWLARIRALEVRDGALFADLADAVLSDMAGPEALRTQFYCELVQGAATQPEYAAPLADWKGRRLAFWHAASEGLDQADLGDILHAFSTDEAAHGLAIGDLAAYRWLRRLNLHRLCRGLIAPADAPDMRQFEIFHAALGAPFAASGRYRPPELSEWQAKAAHHISALIISGGSDAITHRAIAARAGVANSTLAYHFPRQEDLLKAGLNDIIARIDGVIHAPEEMRDTERYELTSVEVARATFAIALAATRMPDLKTVAADMRRRRGENLLVQLNRETRDAPFDLLAAQAVSVTGIGQLMLDATLDPTGAPAFILTSRMTATAAIR
ncbi:TetR family transcriptional regulator [Sphingomonas sp. BIUV-7]|uniref:TetR family transcriptional regulator n=1 Tax=Sphingomonas natans TaxID=3063330 RepID=A0ABT8YD44_9SPHN|nr:TetR family transcriptional regulator [Sphingomonas sp. BIUV-7]MDO6416286.1 TetR family transcriptional regulator [Sphingomonas sp. BIUV-7]